MRRILYIAFGSICLSVAGAISAGKSNLTGKETLQQIFAVILVLSVVVIIVRGKKLISTLVRRPAWAGFLLADLVALILVIFFGFIYKPSSLKVSVIKGPISGASVSVYEFKDNGEKGKLIKGLLISDASGNVNFDLPRSFPKRFLIEAKGGSYVSEATGQTVQLKDSDTLTAVLPAGTKTAAITPFTHMAAALAKARIKGGAKPADAIISANEAVAKQYGLKSILDLPSEGDQYSQLLAGFAQLAQNLKVPSTDLAEALAKDWSDGQADGQKNGQAVAITGGKALGDAGTTGLTKATDQFSKSGKTVSPKEGSTAVNPPPAKVVGFRITTTSLPAWVSGQVGSYTLTATGGSLPLRWTVISGGIPEGFSLSQDGIISGTFTLPSGVTKKIFPKFTVQAKDQKGQTRSIELSITVVPEAPSIATYNPPTLTVGQSYDKIIAKASGGMPPYKFYRETSSGPIPFGMNTTANGSDAHLTGSPKAKGNFSFRVCVVDSAETSKCGDVAFAVKEAEVAAPAPAPAEAECGVQLTISSSHCVQIGTYEDGSPHNIIETIGTAGGPVGAQLYAYMAGGDLATCGAWTTVNGSQEKCRRGEGQPYQTSWKIQFAELPPGDTSDIYVFGPSSCYARSQKETINRSCR